MKKTIDLRNPLEYENFKVLYELYSEMRELREKLYGNSFDFIREEFGNKYDLKSIGIYLSRLEYLHKEKDLDIERFKVIGFNYLDDILFLYPLWAFKIVQMVVLNCKLIYNTEGVREEVIDIDDDTRFGVVFVGFYKEIKTFSNALIALKSGYKVARRGWNGKNMYLFLSSDECTDALEEVKQVNYSVDKFICMKTTQNTIQPGWLASQSDMLACDWELVF